MSRQPYLAIALVVLLGACDETERAPNKSARRPSTCDACPACASTMICLEDAALSCAGSPEQVHAPVACVRPDGTKHGQFKDYEFDQHARLWLEIDGWYVDDMPVGTWVTHDAKDEVVRVVRYVDGQPTQLLPRP